ncbi:metallo-beta-lactamase family [Fusarium circinatum]|uniref:Metallo-beta-lactamase family n=1 Tax=Fusarium circinatum TaxID=48490 RepID=A0A8H5UBQ4_FUSCI|nr:metallo-beta-lactamase family [Fusarium circinatum]
MTTPNTLKMLRNIIFSSLLAASAPCVSCHPKLRTEHFLNSGPSLDMVSTLIIGSEAAAIIDLPLAVPQAIELAEWVAKTTDKPLVAAFASHFHPDHYLSGAAFLAKFPSTKFYANSKAVDLVKNDAAERIKAWKNVLGDDVIVDKATIPTPYALLLSPALTDAWLSTLDFIEHLKPNKVIAGHTTDLDSLNTKLDLEYSRQYFKFFQQNIQSKGKNFFTPKEISKKLAKKFPGRLESSTSTLLLNISSEELGRGGSRLARTFDLTSYNFTALEPWML